MGQRTGTDEVAGEQLWHLYLLMREQWFVAGRSQLIEAGFRSSQVMSWRRRGRLVPVLQGVYSYGRDIETREAAWKAALIFGGDGSALTGLSACEAWGIVRPSERIPRRIEVGRPSRKPASPVGVSPAMESTLFRFRSRQLLGTDVVSRHGLEVVTPSLALIDLAETASEKEVRFAFLEACRLRLIGRSEVDFCFRRAVRRRGASTIKSLLASWVPELARTRSVLEGLFLLAWAESGYPMPLVNVKLLGFEVDMYWPDFEIVLELDGAAFHDDPLSRARDRAKSEQLEVSGRTVLRAGFQQVNSRPHEVVSMVIQAMEQTR